MKLSTVYRKAAELVDGAHRDSNLSYSCLAIDWVVKGRFPNKYTKATLAYQSVFYDENDNQDLQFKLMGCGNDEKKVRVMCLLIAAAAVDDL